MIRVLLIEDEALIRNGILHHIDWNSLQVGEVRAAKDADEAFAILQNFSPNIIISDIRMPGMDGITLCRKLREVLPDCQIIFMSGYSDKEYYRAAITLHAVDYVEKPIDVAVLGDAISRAAARLQTESQRKHALFHELLTGTADPQSQDAPTRETLRSCFPDLLRNGPVCLRLFILCAKAPGQINGAALEQQMNLLHKEQGLFFIYDRMYPGYLSLAAFSSPDIVPDDRMPQLCREMLSLRGKGDWFIVYSDNITEWDNLRKYCSECLSKAALVSFHGWNSFACASEEAAEIHSAIPENERNNFYHMILGGDAEGSSSYLRTVTSKLLDDHVLLNYECRTIYHQLQDCIIRADQRLNGGIHGGRFTEEARAIDSARSILELDEVVAKSLDLLLNSDAHQLKHSRIVRDVCEYVSSHLDNPGLSLPDIASRVYLTPTYLSTVFREVTGKTIGQYITSSRIDRAKELLRNPSMQISEAARETGYEDSKYFARIFKKMTGFTPSEYKDSCMGANDTGSEKTT